MDRRRVENFKWSELVQKIKVEAMIEIPNNYVLITKAEYETFKENELTGIFWSMKDLEQHTGKKHLWLKDKLLYRPEFRKVLDSKNGGVYLLSRVAGANMEFQC